ncbi:hypothetical protein BD410DRAFT_180391 [Rickenella mellea]|uniref:Uncharacterized protein n=1 Tax=Rickenella mellea TaxID=50990 RepID=A0A4Y7PI58_9AGAM|nr:hypothetical protein BD410DRAFT_180391 [Rickenella mellea]
MTASSRSPETVWWENMNSSSMVRLFAYMIPLSWPEGKLLSANEYFGRFRMMWLAPIDCATSNAGARDPTSATRREVTIIRFSMLVIPRPWAEHLRIVLTADDSPPQGETGGYGKAGEPRNTRLVAVQITSRDHPSLPSQRTSCDASEEKHIAVNH